MDVLYLFAFLNNRFLLIFIYFLFESRKQAYFVDLFVRVSNKVAITMYQQLGYIVYRTVLEYYNGDPDEDAYGTLPMKNQNRTYHICTLYNINI